MLPDQPAPIRSASSGLLAVLAALAALAICSCSTLPIPAHPEHVDHRFSASFEVGTDGKLVFPETTRELVVRSIELMPKPAGEQFAPNLRWFVYPAGTSVQANGQLRIYANSSGVIPKLADVLPNAKLHADDTAH